MKTTIKILTAMLIVRTLVVPLPAGAADVARDVRTVNKEQLHEVIRSYAPDKGVHVLTAGPLLLKIMAAIANTQVESEEDKAVIGLLKRLNRVVLVSYEESSEETRARLSAELDRVLRRADKLMEVKEEGEVMKVFGVADKSGSAIKYVVIFVPESCALVCAYGSVPAEKIGELFEMATR